MPLLETRWSQGFWISEENLPESLPTLVLRVEANEGKLAAGFFSAVFGILVAFVIYAIDKDSLYPVDALGAARLVTLAVWTVIWLQYFAVMTRRLTKWSRQVSRVTDVPAVLLVFHRGYVEAVVAELHSAYANISRLSEQAVTFWALNSGIAPFSPTSESPMPDWAKFVLKLTAIAHTTAVYGTTVAVIWAMVWIGLPIALFVLPIYTTWRNPNAGHRGLWDAIALCTCLHWVGLIVARMAGEMENPSPTVQTLEWFFPYRVNTNLTSLVLWISLQTLAVWRPGPHHQAAEETSRQFAPAPLLNRAAGISIAILGVVGCIITVVYSGALCPVRKPSTCLPHLFEPMPFDDVCLAQSNDSTAAHDPMNEHSDAWDTVWTPGGVCAESVGLGIVASGYLSVVLLLLELLLPNVTRKAAGSNHRALEWLVWIGGPNASVVEGPSPLHAAAATGELGAVRLLVNAGADINRQVACDRLSFDVSPMIPSPLAIAAYNGHAQIVELLLERGATLIDCDVSHTAGGWVYTMGPPRVCDVLWRLVSAVRLPEDANLARLDDHELLDLASMYCTRRSYRRRHPCFVYRWLVHLLLCFGRFGGDGSALSRLPTEMVLEIVGFLRFGDMRPIPRAHDTRRLQ